MLIVLPSTPTTEKASQWLINAQVPHCVITIPERLEYKTSSDIALFIPGQEHADIPMRLTKASFVVMRVFKAFDLMPSDEIVFCGQDASATGKNAQAYRKDNPLCQPDK